jgi:hypothetical protein
MVLSHEVCGGIKSSATPIESAKGRMQGDGEMPRCPVERRRRTSENSLQRFDNVNAAVRAFSKSEAEAAK